MDAQKRSPFALPDFPLPSGYASPGVFLEEDILSDFRTYGRQLGIFRDHAIRRIREELSVIRQSHPEYLLIVFDLIRHARREHHPVNVKGNIHSSYVAYIVGIIEKDPLATGFRFEDFINPIHARKTLPDIDIETSREGREFMIRHLVERYGSEHVARIKGYPRGIVLARTMIALISGKDYAWATHVAKLLRIHDTRLCPILKQDFIETALRNHDFRRGQWRDEHTATVYLDGLWKKWSAAPFHLFSQAHCLSGDRTCRQATTRQAIGFVSFADIGNALDRGNRVILLVRHAERPPLKRDDPTFGKDLPLTERGRKSASDYGFELREATFPHPISITTADNKRCTQTGLRIARQIQVGSRGVSHADFLGSGSPYFAKTQDRLALAGEGNYRQALNDYFKTGRQRGFNPLAEATDRLESAILGHKVYGLLKPDLEVFVTHDINVAAFLAGRGVVPQFSDATWPWFLDAAVIFVGPNGRCSYGFLPGNERLPLVYIP